MKKLIFLSTLFVLLISCQPKDTHTKHIYEYSIYNGGVAISHKIIHTDYELKIETSSRGSRQLISNQYHELYEDTNSTIVMNQIK